MFSPTINPAPHHTKTHQHLHPTQPNATLATLIAETLNRSAELLKVSAISHVHSTVVEVGTTGNGQVKGQVEAMAGGEGEHKPR